MIAHTRQGVRFATGIEFCILSYRLRKSGGCDLSRATGSASCDTTHETGGTICYGHWVLRLLEISHARQKVTICFGHWVLHLVISHTKQRVRLVTGIGFFILRYHTRDRGYDLLRTLGSASCDLASD